ncbi:MAG: hypothetical protein IMW89_19815 [Ktedonobacteraceae bacterium]|nr:hypothetical protein [Ktedonobacteraceae bacterium]
MLECLDPMAPDEEVLIRHVLDGQPFSREKEAHLVHCIVCQRRLTRYKRLESWLVARLYRSCCPTTIRLNLYCAALLPAEESSEIAKHITCCPLCAGEVNAIRSILQSFTPFPDTVPDVSAHEAVQHVVAVPICWQTRPAQMVTAGDASGGDPCPCPDLSEIAWPRQYRAGCITISLNLARNRRGETVLLALFSGDDSTDATKALQEVKGALVNLYCSPAHGVVQQRKHAGLNGHTSLSIMSARVDEGGCVAFRSVPTGEYNMAVHLPSFNLIIKELTIQNN